MIRRHRHTSSDVVAALRHHVVSEAVRVKQVTIAGDMEVKTKEKTYTIYFIFVQKTNNRSWIVKKRYSEFDSLFKHLSKKHTTVPQLPPKLIIGNMKEENILKRKKGLQAFVEGILKQPEMATNPIVQQFFELDKDKNIMYELPDALFTHIFQYCTVKELFLVISLTCNWWRQILYKSVPHVDMVFANKNIFFSNIPVNIDTLDQVTSLVKNFTGVKHLRLDRFFDLTDDKLKDILMICPGIDKLTITNCGIKKQVITNLNDLTSIEFSYCRYMTNLDVVLPASLLFRIIHLNISGTSIGDTVFTNLVQKLSGLKKCIASSCSELVAPTIKNDSIEYLDLAYCTKLTKPSISCPNCKYLNLSYTKITDQVLEEEMESTIYVIRELHLSGCSKLKKPKIMDFSNVSQTNNRKDQVKMTFVMQATNITQIQQLINQSLDLQGEDDSKQMSVQRLYMDACPNLTDDTIIKCPNSLKVLDLRLSTFNMSKGKLKKILGDNELLNSFLYNVNRFQFADMCHEAQKEILNLTNADDEGASSHQAETVDKLLAEE